MKELRRVMSEMHYDEGFSYYSPLGLIESHFKLIAADGFTACSFIAYIIDNSRLEVRFEETEIVV